MHQNPATLAFCWYYCDQHFVKRLWYSSPLLIPQRVVPLSERGTDENTLNEVLLLCILLLLFALKDSSTGWFKQEAHNYKKQLLFRHLDFLICGGVLFFPHV